MKSIHLKWTWRAIIDFDAVPLLKKVKIPVLVILGEDDRRPHLRSQAIVWIRSCERAGTISVSVTFFTRITTYGYRL